LNRAISAARAATWGKGNAAIFWASASVALAFAR
jgi:hypothetical protein